jgi:hypothetical protein
MPLFFVIKQLNRGIQCFSACSVFKNICADLLVSDKARLVPTAIKGTSMMAKQKRAPLAGALMPPLCD